MRSTLTGFVVGILVFFGTGFLSYLYLTQTVGTRDSLTTLVATTLPLQKKPTTAVSTIVKPIVAKSVASKNVITPGPLRVITPAPTSSPATLTVRGVIAYTNAARSLNGGLRALTENQLLDQDAQMKVNDMFAKQYFEHVSPTNVGPSNLADNVGYEYILVGENLALGGFTSDDDLVTAWMNSPGHRANILNTNYQEIGVAVGWGKYEGRDTWLAVQSFGMPRSACPIINNSLKTQIDSNSAIIANLRAQLDAKKAQIDATAQNDPNYNIYVGEFNAIIPQYNKIIEANRINVENYNAEVRAYNDCINAASPHAVTS